MKLGLKKGMAFLMFSEAVALITRLYEMGTLRVYNPVSRLQREFRLGYRSACLLARLLDTEGYWRRTIDLDGTHIAILAPIKNKT
ncbi:hypothetical protein GTP23_12710 [Pseudoduganella sp. FT93W]|uniref:FtsK gamma domain-containing protein n=1 Tax=Duganella fentianensis TaxID=2692177 RepID=A0A845HY36_9BURK|nr:hypothetical protein [Duganella fentianensis]MYN45909.1 hypothetical protein [Duganella fentianensis]